MKKLLFLSLIGVVSGQLSHAMNQETDFQKMYGSSAEQAAMDQAAQRMSIRWAQDAARKGENLYIVVGVDRNASIDEIESAYRRRASVLKRARNIEDLKRLNHAKDILTNPQARAAYDRAFPAAPRSHNY